MSYPNNKPKSCIIIVESKNTIKKIKAAIKKYKTPNFTFKGQIGNNTINKIKITKRIKYINGLFDFSTFIFNK